MNQDKENTDRNMQLLADLRAENPFLTHIYFRREDGVLVDIPVDQAEFKIRTKPKWVVDSSGSTAQKAVSVQKNPWQDKSHSVQNGPVEVPAHQTEEIPPNAQIEVPPRPSEAAAKSKKKKNENSPNR